MFRFRIVAIAVVAILLAAYAGADAFARVNERQLPEIAARLPVRDGFNLARAAEHLLQLASKPSSTPGGEPVLALNPAHRSQAVRLSRDGYRQEPLNYRSARNLGVIAAADNKLAIARAFYQVSNSLTRRDLTTNIWLARDFAQRNDMKAALGAFDRALRTSAQAQTLLLPRLLEFLQNGQVVPLVVQLLEQNPPWSDQFWGEASHHPGSLANVARVREAIARKGHLVPQQYDKVLIPELASHQHFAEAEALVGLLSHDMRPRGELIRDGNFDEETPFAPFGWELFFDSSLSTDLNRSEGELRISTYSDGSGRSARQLISLTPGTYTLTVKAGDWDRMDPNALYVRLDCAQGQGAKGTRLELDMPVTVKTIVPQPGCTHYWFSVFAVPREDRRDNTVVLDSISLRPAAGGIARSPA